MQRKERAFYLALFTLLLGQCITAMTWPWSTYPFHPSARIST